MTAPELVELRTELIQTAAVIVSALEDIDYGVAKAHTTEGDNFIAGRTDLILAEILGERFRQDLKWGPQHHRIADWLAIIGEEYGEACMAYVDDLLIPTVLEQNRIGDAKPVRWGKADPPDYGTPTTARIGDPNVKTMEQIFDEARRDRVFRDRDDDDHDPNEGRFERQD